MLFYYVRHGDPIYNPDSLTPLGERQAESLAHRLSLHGIDRVFSSTSNRAILTAKPTCEILKKEPVLLDFAYENHAYEDFSVKNNKGIKTWFFSSDKHKETIASEEIINLGFKWYEHELFSEERFKNGIERIYNASDEFFKELGYEHIRYTGKYKVTKNNDEKVAFFAHLGFGLSFLSCILDIPLPIFTTRFDMTHTGVTLIEFKEQNGYCIPKVLTFANDSHLYKDGLPTKFANGIYI